jgi:hypothetical protein
MNRPGWLSSLSIPALMRGTAVEPLAREPGRRVYPDAL